MILSRLISLILRFAQFVSAVVVLGLSAHFIRVHSETQSGPFGRIVYTLIIAILSTILALVWMIPTTRAMLNIPADILLSLAWFAAFGVLVNWLRRSGCGNAFSWGNITRGTACDQWQAAEAFSFLSGIFWAASAIIGLWVGRSVSRSSRVRTTV